MAASGFKLNGFEGVLFKTALVLGGFLILARLGTMLLLAFFHHTH